MAPLVTNGIITENMNLMLAFFIGIGFGFVLESAGFSSSRKLAGMFYGYDTTVMKVFFTAAIVAMLGTILLGLFGWLDLSVIYVNPTYLWSAILGGVIMGAGFIMGGFCPGTAFCGAAIGKLDALAFIGGLFIGVLIFMEAYPLFEKVYTTAFMGTPFIYDSLGLSRGLFALILILAALGMFWVGEWAEKRWPREEY